MALKKFKPITAGTRWKIGNQYTEITTNVPEKSLLTTLKSTGGRNSKGSLTVRYMGGGHKRRYRIIDFKRNKFNIPGKVASIEYDPYRTAFIALINYVDGEKRYIIAPKDLHVGMTIMSGEAVAPEIGNALMLKNMPEGVFIHNIEMQPGKGGQLVRSAGTAAQLTSKEDKYAVIKMPSGELRKILINCFATIGTVSNSDHNLESLGKAGANRWRGIKPHNRGVAMNPVDHPMGGGEGKASGGHPRSRKGLYAKGLKTRSTKKSSSQLILQTRKGKKLSTK